MAFKNVRNLLLINHNDGFINDDEFVVLHDLYASKNLDFPYDSYAPFDPEELDESESFAEFRLGKRDVRILKEVLQIPDTNNWISLCWEIRSAYRSLTTLAVTLNSGISNRRRYFPYFTSLTAFRFKIVKFAR